MPKKRASESNVPEGGRAAAPAPAKKPRNSRGHALSSAGRAASPEAPPPPVSSLPPAVTGAATVEHEEIARVAYSYWEARGRIGGDPEDDWFRAESELRRQTG